MMNYYTVSIKLLISSFCVVFRIARRNVLNLDVMARKLGKFDSGMILEIFITLKNIKKFYLSNAELL